MKQVVIKGESVYQCDVCKRKVRVPTNRFGLDVMQRCNITSGCKGKLTRVTLIKDVNSTPAFPPEIEGVADWFQRKILYTHEQSIESTTWLIEHDLGNKPILHVYNNQVVDSEVTLVTVEPQSVRTIDLNTTELTFSRAVSGLVQCVSLTSSNITNSTAITPTTASTAPVQITTDISELTIATLSVASEIDLTVSFVTASDQPNVDIEYTEIDTTASLDSPWSGVRRVMINGRRYTVRSFNMATSSNAAVAFEAGLIPNGSAFRITALNSAPLAQHDVLILTARSPFSFVDRDYNQYIDPFLIDVVDPELYWDEAKAFCRKDAVKGVYPAILVV